MLITDVDSHAFVKPLTSLAFLRALRVSTQHEFARRPDAVFGCRSPWLPGFGSIL